MFFVYYLCIISEAQWFDPQPLQSACQSVLEQDTDPKLLHMLRSLRVRTRLHKRLFLLDEFSGSLYKYDQKPFFSTKVVYVEESNQRLQTPTKAEPIPTN